MGPGASLTRSPLRPSLWAPGPQTPDDKDHGLRSRLSWITGLRLVFLTLILGAVAFFYLDGGLGRYPRSMRVVLGAIGVSYALGAVYAAVLRHTTRGESDDRRRLTLRRLAHVQVIFDQFVWTAIVYVSGGPASGATAFYALTCLTGAVLIGARGAALAGVIGVALYGLLGIALHVHWIDAPSDQAAYPASLSFLAYPFLLNALGIGIVALLGGYLADRLRITGGALVEAQARVRRTERLAELGRISAWLAHEIRNPLGSISGSVEMIREAPGLEDEDRRLCDIVQREVTRLNELVGDMLDLAKPMTPEPTQVDIAALAKEVVELARRSSGEVFVRYSGPDTAVAFCDGAHMRQVAWNLVRNAIQASPARGDVDVEVHPGAGGVVELTVSDQGPGIPDAVKPTVFDAFYSSRSQGAGIGLAVVKRIVDDHARFGAVITIRDRTPRGTAFTVSLAGAGNGS